MPTHETDGQQNGLGAAVKEVTARASSLIRLELELASLEVKKKIGALGLGIGLGAGAALFAVFFFGFLFATIAAALATFLPWWAALLIVTGVLFLLTAILGIFSVRAIKRGTPPVPKQAIHEAKMTAGALKGNGAG
jgi:uncharacterized membrane protein YqjE